MLYLIKIEFVIGVTAYTTGKITSQHGLFYNYLENKFGENTAKAYLETNENAIKSIKRIIDTEKIDCDFEFQNAFVYTNSEEKLEIIKKEIKTLNKMEFDAFFTEKTELPIKTLGAIAFKNQAQFHARKYCKGLIDTIPKNYVYEHSKVADIQKDGDIYKIYCENGNYIKSKFVVIASHYPIKNFPGFYFIKMYQDKSYLIAVDTKENLFDGMYISAEEPVTSFRTAEFNGKRLLLVGGSGHKTGDTQFDINSAYKNLENYIKGIYPKAEILFRWSTEDCVTLDKIPYIGQFSSLMPNVFVATGYKKWGMTTSYVAAEAIYRNIIGNPNINTEIYKATRFSPIKNKEETGNMLKQTTNSFFLNKLKEPSLNYEDLTEGEGGIVEYNGKKIGVYKKSKKEVYTIKPYCTHLGCELSWNSLEKTWDCPCHGSRFDYTGKIITEPSKKDLERIDI